MYLFYLIASELITLALWELIVRIMILRLVRKPSVYEKLEGACVDRVRSSKMESMECHQAACLTRLALIHIKP